MKGFMFAALVIGCGACEIEPGAVEAGATRPIGPLPGPTVTVTQRATGDLALSWSEDASASAYHVFQSAAGGAYVDVATVFDSSGGPPATSYIASGLTAGTVYCYAIQSSYASGAVSNPGAVACMASTGSGGSCALHSVPDPAVVTVSRPPRAQELAVSWTPVASAVSYTVYESVRGGPMRPVACVSGPSYSAIGLTSGDVICFVVAARFADGAPSALSAAACMAPS